MGFERIMGLNVTDDEAYQKYREEMEPILNSIGAAFGYDFKIAEVLRSKTDQPINRVFTIDFPNRAVMQAFFERPDYLAIKQRHLDGAINSKTVIALHETDA
ncbi:MAG: DUF1330 domain-containing protein [Candidatus Thiodiazotropha lotti]|uniref:DUF1330 domain-containing protein n=1 Tax=Candidatus Thiodiazotropha endoloripes TaxID=1818881 RepID=A0A1E2UNN1_9GAMM|nr:DUF1330 domain-containing protein [Candidatus Thiodiazotropha endoloripes]MCG7899269.1 DUF1330 domain-containing protein [Candidatus Thiodiazotropha weberae]MCG7993345.1 DUF1330 domain-containing protein [Candidatus Thiodiazotropha lotti]MCG7903753.1 DUF1330 domain-containing protein [Candidatus Thiodiazotropha weberae]MCG7915253.1 DUF1330 domain-containing protein [Candidatus Thiodiazotropha weberae]MCG7998138.1 DUF1330 domain-containing protein [Candidatus Thiodiazotropha lotti]